jgi:hypothetical protein
MYFVQCFAYVNLPAGILKALNIELIVSCSSRESLALVFLQSYEPKLFACRVSPVRRDMFPDAQSKLT